MVNLNHAETHVVLFRALSELRKVLISGTTIKLPQTVVSINLTCGAQNMSLWRMFMDICLLWCVARVFFECLPIHLTDETSDRAQSMNLWLYSLSATGTSTGTALITEITATNWAMRESKCHFEGIWIDLLEKKHAWKFIKFIECRQFALSCFLNWTFSQPNKSTRNWNCNFCNQLKLQIQLQIQLQTHKNALDWNVKLRWFLY